MNINYAVALFISAAISAAIALVIWKRRAAPGASGLMLFMLAEIVWSGTYAVRWLMVEPDAQLFWLDATYIGVAFHTTFLIIFVLQFTNRSQLLTRRNLILLAIVPVLTLLLLWTDDWHGLFYGGVRTTGTILNGGPWFWFFVIYAYAQIFITIGLYIQAFIRASAFYRLQTGAILFAACLPVIANILSLAGFRPFPNLDITPFIFTISGLIYAYGLFGFRLLDVVPVARDRLVEEMADGVIVLDVQNRIVDVNPAVQRMIGISTNEIGKPISDISQARLNLRQTDDPKAVILSEVRIMQEQVVRDIELQVLPLLDKQQNISGHLLILHDISTRKQAELALREAHDLLEQRVRERTAELNAANLGLEKAARMKDEFLASMSHELRTPLTGILGLSDVLQLPGHDPLTERQKTSLTHIHNSGQHLLELINDILDLSRIGSGKFGLNLSPCSLEEICQSSLRMVESKAVAKGLQASFTMTPQSIVLKADAPRIQQILLNLLNNAVKFTPQGGSFGIEVLGDSSEEQVRITVWDTGIGIKEEDIARLFQPFIQLDASLARQYSGTGLGLALVKNLVEMHCGSVFVESIFGKGSRFIVILPWQAYASIS